MPLVRYLAERLKSRLPEHIDVGDLVSAGSMGLISAIENYDSTQGMKFESYCTVRVNGTMLDDLRHSDWVPRQVRARANRLERAYHSLRTKLQRKPTEKELAEKMGLSAEEIHDCLMDARSIGLVSLDETIRHDGRKEISRADIVDNKKGIDPISRLQVKEMKEIILKGLSDREKQIVVLYYYDQLTMKEIALILGMSESRVCQMHTEMLDRIRKRFVGREDELVA
jgi:RNA polymerase sigma factor for flagellar operon FliA